MGNTDDDGGKLSSPRGSKAAAIHLSVFPILMNVISQQLLEGISSNLILNFTWTRGETDAKFSVKLHKLFLL